MLEIITRSYKASDGKVFSSKEECLKYEKANFLNDENYTLYHSNGEKVSFDTLIHGNFDIVVIKNEEAAKRFEEIFGIGLYPSKAGIYCYDYVTDEWTGANHFLYLYEENFGIYDTLKKIMNKK